MSLCFQFDFAESGKTVLTRAVLVLNQFSGIVMIRLPIKFERALSLVYTSALNHC